MYQLLFFMFTLTVILLKKNVLAAIKKIYRINREKKIVALVKLVFQISVNPCLANRLRSVKLT